MGSKIADPSSKSHGQPQQRRRRRRRKQQVGICDIHITVGRKEEKAFKEAQDYLKATKEASKQREGGRGGGGMEGRLSLLQNTHRLNTVGNVSGDILHSKLRPPNITLFDNRSSRRQHSLAGCFRMFLRASTLFDCSQSAFIPHHLYYSFARVVPERIEVVPSACFQVSCHVDGPDGCLSGPHGLRGRRPERQEAAQRTHLGEDGARGGRRHGHQSPEGSHEPRKLGTGEGAHGWLMMRLKMNAARSFSSSLLVVPNSSTWWLKLCDWLASF